MKFYKIVNDNTIIGVINEKDFRKFQPKNKILLVCNAKQAQYARLNDTLYRDRSWMGELITDKYEYKSVDIINIGKDDYDILLAAIKSGEEIKVENDKISEVIIDKDESLENDKITLEYIKNKKILDMSKICNKNITNGFDIVLSDGRKHHFSLTLEDQMNLMNINNLVKYNDKLIYHADNEPYKYFSSKDLKLIIKKAYEFKLQNTVYFNNLKFYIKSLKDIQSVNKITYGMRLPDNYKLDI